MIQIKLKNFIISTFSVIFAIFICLIIANIIFIKISTQKIFPRSLSGSLPSILQTFNPDTYNKNNLQNYVAIIGGSYAQGGGDAYLTGKYNYSITHHLHNYDNKNYLIFGRAGSGSISAVSDLIKIYKHSNLPNMIENLKKPSSIIYLIYEGYDFEANFLEYTSLIKTDEKINEFISRRINENIKLNNIDKLNNIFTLVPFLGKMFDHLKSLFNKIIQEKELSKIKFLFVERIKKLFGHAIILGDFKEDRSGYNNSIKNNKKIANIRPLQGAALSLTNPEILIALKVFFGSIKYIQSWSQLDKITIVYIPSPISSYTWNEPIIYETRDKKEFKTISNEKNNLNSTFIRDKINNYSKKNNIQFLDLTDYIAKKGKKTILHGPLDWRHLNNRGYKIASNYIIENIEKN